MGDVTMQIDEGERQMILLAISELALSRPGWNWALGELADKLYGRDMFEEFKVTSGPFVTETRPEAIERFRSTKTIIVNGLEKKVEGHQISYQQLVVLAGKDPAMHPSVTYGKGVGNSQGIMVMDDVVALTNGMVFNAIVTGSA